MWILSPYPVLLLFFKSKKTNLFQLGSGFLNNHLLFMQPVSNDTVPGKWWVGILTWLLKMLFSYFIVSWTEELYRNWSETEIFYKLILYWGESNIPPAIPLPHHFIKNMFKIIPVLHVPLLLSVMICGLNLHQTTCVHSSVITKLLFS